MTLITELLLLAFGIACATSFSATLLIWWFTTGFPVHLTKLLRCLGYRKDDALFWPGDADYKFWYRTHWANWINTTDLRGAVKEGVNCPGCMSCHTSWIAGVLVSLALCPFQHWWASIASVLLSAWVAPAWAMLALDVLKAIRVYIRANKPDPLAQ